MAKKTLIQRYRSDTPALWVFIGESVALLGTALSTGLAGMEVSKWWVISSIVLTWLGERVTKFASVREKPNEPV